MKVDLTNGTWQDNIWCPIIMIPFCTSDDVMVDTQYVGISDGKKQQLRQLQEELAEFNCVWYRTLSAIANRVRNVLRSSKKVSMILIDHINQQAVATYVREVIWPGNKSFQRVGVSGGMIKEVCVRWYKKMLHYLWLWMESHTGRQWY